MKWRLCKSSFSRYIFFPFFPKRSHQTRTFKQLIAFPVWLGKKNFFFPFFCSCSHRRFISRENAQYSASGDPLRYRSAIRTFGRYPNLDFRISIVSSLKANNGWCKTFKTAKPSNDGFLPGLLRTFYHISIIVQRHAVVGPFVWAKRKTFFDDTFISQEDH